MKEFAKLAINQMEMNSNQWNRVLLGQSVLTITPDMYRVTLQTLRIQAIDHNFKTSIKDGNLIIYK